MVLDRNSLFSAFVYQYFGGISIFVHLAGGWIQMTPVCPSISLSCNEAFFRGLPIFSRSKGRTQRYILGGNPEAGEWEALELCSCGLSSSGKRGFGREKFWTDNGRNLNWRSRSSLKAGRHHQHPLHDKFKILKQSNHIAELSEGFFRQEKFWTHDRKNFVFTTRIFLNSQKENF